METAEWSPVTATEAKLAKELAIQRSEFERAADLRKAEVELRKREKEAVGDFSAGLVTELIRLYREDVDGVVRARIVEQIERVEAQTAETLGLIRQALREVGRPSPPTRAEIEAARQTRAQLAEWGVPWPPPRGWRKQLLHEADQRERP